MSDLARLMVRLVVGGLMTGHGAQKLFGSFEGPGMKGTAGWLESMGLKPGERWAAAAGASEFGGGLLTALGLFNPLGPLGVLASMAMATGKAHWGKPIWVTSGGAELPIINMTVAMAVGLAGPGRYSLDRLFGFRLPAWFVALATGATVAGIAMGFQSQPEPEPAPMSQPTTEADVPQAAAAPAG